MMELTSDQITQIILALIGLASTVITVFLIPYIKANTTKKQREIVYNIVKIAVQGAEQLKNAGIITLPKKEYVINYLNGKGLKISEEDLDIMIESAVKELNLLQNKITE